MYICVHVLRPIKARMVIQIYMSSSDEDNSFCAAAVGDFS